MIENMIEELREEKEKLLLKVVKIDSAIESLEQIESQVLYTDKESDRPKIRKLLGIKAEKKLKRKYKKKGDWRKSRKRSKEKVRAYPKMMVYFVKQNMNEMRTPELAEAVNKKFNVNISPQNLSKWMWSKALKRKKRLRSIKDFKYKSHTPERSPSGKIIPKKKKLFSEQVDEFIKKKWPTNKDSELRQLMGEKFNVWYTIDQIKAHRRMIGCVSTNPGPKEKKSEKKGTDITNTPEQDLTPQERILKEEIKEEEDNLDMEDMDED